MAESADANAVHADDDLADSAGAVDDEEDLFHHIYGHQGAKVVLRSALREGDTHVLLVGPPGSGKSAFLQALEDGLPGVRYVDGESVRKSRMKDLLKEDPPILLVDEMDEMDADTYRALAVPMEHGRVVKEASREQYDVDIDTQVIGSCNDTDRIPAHIVSRMRVVEFDGYTEEEFTEVCKHMLPREVGWVETDAHAEKVARISLELEGDTDPRVARDIAKLAEGPDEVETVAKALHDPNADVEDVSLTPTDVKRTRGEVTKNKLADTLACEVVTPGDCGVEAADVDARGGGEADETAVREEVSDDIDQAIEDELAEEATEA